MKHTLAVSFENQVNAVPRITGLFSGKGYQVDSISFGQGEQPGLSRMTITTGGDEHVIEQITKQLHKLVDVTKVVDLTFEPFVERDLALVKVNATASMRSEIMQIGNIFRSNIIDISHKTITLEVTGKEDKVNAAIDMLRQFGIIEIARTGSVALKREFQGKL